MWENDGSNKTLLFLLFCDVVFCISLFSAYFWLMSSVIQDYSYFNVQVIIVTATIILCILFFVK